MRVYPLAISLSLLSSLAIASSEYEEWLKSNQPDYAQSQKEFQQYLDENDQAFIGFLKQQWKEVEIEAPQVRDPQPKPISLPVAPKPAKPIKKGPDSPIADPVQVKPIAKPKPLPRPKPIAAPTQPSKKPTEKLEFAFYGKQVQVIENKALKKRFSGRINNENIADYWKQLASKPHKATIQELQAIATQLDLNDWSSALLFDQYARMLHPRDETSRRLTSWFLLVKAGYNARLAYNRDVYLLMPAKQQIFGVTYFTFSGTRYYAVSLNDKPVSTGKVYTYSGNHSDGAKVLNFAQPNSFKPNDNLTRRTLSFEYEGQKHNINVSYHRDLVPYYASYPQLDLPFYFAAGLPSQTQYELLTQLKPLVEGASEQEAVNMLLRFVQTAFEYKTDEDQFSQENYLVPLETLHYPYSDCEDRAALFAWLTRKLLGVDVVILKYPGHVAAAVALSQTIKGDAWNYKGKRYTVADPTYINASAGMTMPSLKGKTPSIASF